MKWTRRTTAKVAALLARQYEILVSDRTVARLMIQRGFSLLVNEKKLAGADHPLRDAPFQRIAVLRARSAHEDIPIISINTKKKELVGRFRNPGAKWGNNTPELVHDHDFPSDAEGATVPDGIYDMTANTGSFINPPCAQPSLMANLRRRGNRFQPLPTKSATQS